MSKTLLDKIWESKIVKKVEGGGDVLYVDAHYIHEVTSPQAFEGLKKRNLKVFRPKQTFATVDHNVPTINQEKSIEDIESKAQIDALKINCENNSIDLWGLNNLNQGIVHVIGPELGITQPGKIYVCGDSHTSTHGALGAIAFGIGTSEVEMVLASQCLFQTKPKQMRIEVNGKLNSNVTAKDLALFIINKLTTSGGTGYFIEFCGSTISNLSIEGRMTLCNMSIEMGSKGGIIAPDETTITYLMNREYVPKNEEWQKHINYWKSLYSDQNAKFDKEIKIDANEITPMITYGTNPGMSIGIGKHIPSVQNIVSSKKEKDDFYKSLNYMGFKELESISNKKIKYVFLGSCTNGRIEDFRLFTKTIKGKQKAKHVNALLVPGSKKVEAQIKSEGLDLILKEAGFEIRQPGCSACLAMNDDKIPSGEYCVSTSNRNFEGRQGPGARTLLASPYIAALVAINGYIPTINKI